MTFPGMFVEIGLETLVLKYLVAELIDVGVWRRINLDRWMIDSMAEELVKQVPLVVYGRYDINFGDIDIDADCRVNAGTTDRLSFQTRDCKQS